MTFDEFTTKHPDVALAVESIPERTDGVKWDFGEPSEYELGAGMIPRHYRCVLSGASVDAFRYAFEYSKGSGHVRWKARKDIKPSFHDANPRSLLGRGVFKSWKPGEHVPYLPRKMSLAEYAAWPEIVEPIPPDLADVLESLASDWSSVAYAPSFAQWCCEFGYDDDSIKALKIFHTTLDSKASGMHALGGEAFEDLLEIEW